MQAVYQLSPELEERLEFDMLTRLESNGFPTHRGNDYERHLLARKLRIEGKSRQGVSDLLFALGLEDISINKRASYVEDILNSVLVGFSHSPLPIYEEDEEVN